MGSVDVVKEPKRKGMPAARPESSVIFWSFRERRSILFLSMLGAGLLGGIAGIIRSMGLPSAKFAPPSAFLLIVQFGRKSGDAFNILWALVFGFATLNILSLVTRRFEPNRNRMSPGELMAVATVVVSVLLLGFEMLGIFHVLPLRLPLH